MIDRIRTRYGPLVRGWGDATPATKNDVAVRVNGVAVIVSDVNPYTGEIFLAVPLAPAAPGTRTVEVDYIWLTNPVFPLSGLNTEGLTLNTWDRAVGHSPVGSNPIPSTSVGVAKTNRFPMGIVLGPLRKTSPQKVGHKYIGFQKGYSALLNTPTTLLLNQNPHKTSIGGLTASAIREVGSFNGKTTPPDANSPWVLEGVDTGALVGDGTYRVIDASSGPFGIGTAAVYSRDVDLALTTSVTSSARLYVESYTADGVFTGVGYGLHDGLRLFLVGCLIVDGVQHVGVLIDGENSHLEASWSIGPALTVSASTQTTLTLPATALPLGVTFGSRFRVASGVQAGTYTITDCGVEVSEDGAEVVVTITPALPSDVSLFEGASFEALFEVIWDTGLISFRSTALFPAGDVSVYLGGGVSGLIATVSTLPPYPAQTALLLPATEKGVAFWGSISRLAKSSSIWDFSQYASNPQRLTQTAEGISVSSPMTTLTPPDEVDPWYIVGGFGRGSIEAGELLLKSTSGSPDQSIDEQFSYERVEPFLNTKVSTNFQATLSVESGILGAGDAEIQVRDGVRAGVLRTLLYTDGPSGKALVTDLPQESLSGLQDPVAVGWVKAGTLPDPFVRGQTLLFSKASAQSGNWVSPALVPSAQVDARGVILEARLSVQSYTMGDTGIGFGFGCRVPVPASPGNSRFLYASLVANGLQLYDTLFTAVFNIPLVWDDGAMHSFRLYCDPVGDIVVVEMDDAFVGSVALTNFSASTGDSFLFLAGVGTGVAEVTLDSASLTFLTLLPLAGETIERTFGILLRGKDPDDIDAYKVPRGDVLLVPNSDATADVLPMDWRTDCDVRLYLDPTWGLSFYRPDLAAPPWYTGDFVTDTTDPTAAWATVEYRQLPVVKALRGSVAFGSLDPRSITQQRWSGVRYDIRGAARGFGIAPQGMVLNRATTLTSGEFTRDMTLEVMTINSRTSTSVYLPDSAIYADRVFIVQVDATVLPSSGWTYDKASQILTLSAPLSSAQHPVTVTFAPAKPVTKTYLEKQSIYDTVTVLNQGTPPVPWSRTLPSTRTVVVDGNYESVEFTDGPESLYADFQKIQTLDGDSVHITPLCDGPGPGQGFAELGIEGSFTFDQFTKPGGGQGGVIGGSASHFNSARVLTLSGGVHRGGVIGAGGAILYPSSRGVTSGPVPPGGMGMNQDFRLLLTDVTPREEDLSVQTLLGDNTPPASALPITSVNPDGTPGIEGHGACAYVMSTLPASVSIVGPTGGIAFLSQRSLLAGGAQLNGTQFVLSGGAPIAGRVVTAGSIEAAN